MNNEQLFTEVELASDEYPSMATDSKVNNCFSMY